MITGQLVKKAVDFFCGLKFFDFGKGTFIEKQIDRFLEILISSGEKSFCLRLGCSCHFAKIIEDFRVGFQFSMPLNLLGQVPYNLGFWDIESGWRRYRKWLEEMKIGVIWVKLICYRYDIKFDKGVKF